MSQDFVQERSSIAARPRLHADERTMVPVHLLAITYVNGRLARHRMYAHNWLPLRNELRRKRQERLVGLHFALCTTRAGDGVKTLKARKLVLKVRR
jgi:hypothetical protein